MIERVAVVPHPPLLVPELVVADDPDVRLVRDTCLAVAAELAAAASRWVAVGADPTGPRHLGADAAGTFRGYGVDVAVRLGTETTDARPDPLMPLPALVAGWLRGQVGVAEVPVHLLPPDLPPDECRALGERLAGDLADPAEPVGLLVLGDGSHRHGERAVGRPDPRAAAFDDAVHAALAAADTDALRGLDPAVAAELGAAGRAPWQVLAGVVAADGRRWKSVDARRLVPFGVAYHVAVWEPVR